MSPDSWRAWSPEPWDATLNGTIHRAGVYLGEMDETQKEDPSYASDLDVANAARAAACVNAMAAVPRPEIVPDVLEDLAQILADEPEDMVAARDSWGRARRLLAQVTATN